MKRVLEIEKFRNIGLESKETFVLNNSMKKGEMGNLVILIGENNSGKSNVLDALLAFGSGKIAERDFTELNYDEKYQNPKISLTTKGDDGIYKYKITGKGLEFVECPEKDAYNAPEAIRLQCLKLIDTMRTNFNSGNIHTWDNSLFEFEKILSNNTTVDIITQTFNSLTALTKEIFDYSRRYGHSYIKENIINTCRNNIIIESVLNQRQEYDLSRLDEDYKNRFGIKFFPSIYKYQEKSITTAMLSTSYNQLGQSEFFNELLASIDVKSDLVINTYNSFIKTKNKGILIKLENELNKKLNLVAKRFNDLFFKDSSYTFKFDLESEKMYFAIFKDEQSLNLDRQSTGFKWFFNLYFNLLYGKKIMAGDIIIMDEPATNLHVLGQTELRKELKQFAIKNDITIVIATHSPFLIDLDYLDELRFVFVDGNISKIVNDFTAVDLDNPDTLRPVKKALTVSNHILCSPDSKVVFVEGITDYNYMVTFKKLFKCDDIVFLPVNGIGTEKSKQLQISKRLIEIKKREPILMVDGDGAGKAIKKLNNDSALTVISLSDVDEQFKTIETLFSKDDSKKYGIVDENGEYVKHSSSSSIFKTFDIVNNAPSKQTEKNFKKLFDYLSSL